MQVIHCMFDKTMLCICYFRGRFWKIWKHCKFLNHSDPLIIDIRIILRAGQMFGKTMIRLSLVPPEISKIWKKRSCICVRPFHAKHSNFSEDSFELRKLLETLTDSVRHHRLVNYLCRALPLCSLIGPF